MKYVEVYPPKFTTLEVKGLVQESNTKNLIYVTLKANVNIEILDFIYFEFPTTSTDGTILSLEDLGLSLNEGSEIDVDVLTGSAS